MNNFMCLGDENVTYKCSMYFSIIKRRYCAPINFYLTHLAPVVQTSDSAIHRINHYPADSVIDFRNTYPLDSDLSVG